MPLREIAYRSRQEISKLLERRAPADIVSDPEAWLEGHAPALARPQAAEHLIKVVFPLRFFEGASDLQVAATLATRFPDASQEIVAAADTLLDKRFDVLGYQHVWFGDPIDWHFDPVWKRRTPLAHWSRFDPLDHALVGDSKIVWELNRHQWLVRLAQAWRITGREKYAAACVDAIDAWRDANPPALGINWTSSLELSYRLISWCWTLALLRDAPVLSGRWIANVLVSIWQHADHIARHLSYYSSPNTHLTGEALGLVYAGLLFPEFHDAGHWQRVGTRVLTDECHTQIHPDGIHFEQSTCYQAYTIDIYLHLLLLARRNGLALSGEATRKVQQMIDFLVTVRRPDGTIPAIGDGDGGTLLPIVPRAANDSRGRIGVAAALFNRQDFAWATRDAPPELLWLMGTAGLEHFDTLTPAPPSHDPSRVFPSGGYAVMRSDWAPDAHHLIVDVGPLGCPTSSGHGHADLLGVQCAIFGEPCLVDAGTYSYTPEPAWRDFFRSTTAHSTVCVDGQSQAAPAGPFSWKTRPKVRLRSWHTDPHVDVLDAEHDAYRDLGVTCRRRVIFVKPHYWLVVDDIEGSGLHQIDLTFQFAPTMEVSLGPTGWAQAETAQGRTLWVMALASTPIGASTACGDTEPIRGWVSSDYGQRQPAPALVYSGVVPLPWRSITLLLPDASAAGSPPAVEAIHDDDGRPIGVDLGSSHRSAQFDEHGVIVTR